MRIGEIAKHSGVSASRIRFYEARGLLPAAQRGDNGYRDYSPVMVQTLKFIESAQALGFTLSEIASAISTTGEATVASDLVLPALERKLADLEAHIAASKALRAQLIKLIATQKECNPPSLVSRSS